jgi:hypothetical protein
MRDNKAFSAERKQRAPAEKRRSTYRCDMKQLSLIIAFSILICSSAFGDDLQERKLKIQSMDKGTISKEAASRKANSIKRLKKEKVPFIEHLPVIEDSIEAKNRTKEEICYRAVALCIVAVKGEGLEQDVIKSLVSKYNIAPKFSPKEESFIINPAIIVTNHAA